MRRALAVVAAIVVPGGLAAAALIAVVRYIRRRRDAQEAARLGDRIRRDALRDAAGEAVSR